MEAADRAAWIVDYGGARPHRAVTRSGETSRPSQLYLRSRR
jgi:hypothetical protein